MLVYYSVANVAFVFVTSFAAVYNGKLFWQKSV